MCSVCNALLTGCSFDATLDCNFLIEATTALPPIMPDALQVPELNVQNGVLKALSFLFEYIGEMGKDYIYAVSPLLEDALMDRDLVHRQTAASVVQHMRMGVSFEINLPLSEGSLVKALLGSACAMSRHLC